MLRLGIFSAICLSLLTIIFIALEDKITLQNQKNLSRVFKELTPEQEFDANFLEQSQKIKLGNIDATLYQQNNIYYIEAITQKGYNGEIKILLALDAQNTIRGVRVLNHKETPGLGDKIETRISPWILEFSGKNLENATFAVKKDGGDFDAFTGATITPRAITNLIGEILTQWQKENETRN